MTEFLTHHLNSFEEQILLFIPEYYNLITKDTISLTNTLEWHTKVLELCKKHQETEWIINFVAKRNLNYNEKFEFVVNLDIIQGLYELYQNEELRKNQSKKLIKLKLKLSKSIFKEIIMLRNVCAHSRENEIDDGLIQRLFENFFYYIKYLSIPQIKNILTDYTKKDISLNLRTTMYLNLEKNYFQIDKNTYNNFYFENCSFNNKNDDTDLSEFLSPKEIESYYNSIIPKNFVEFKCFKTEEEADAIDEENQNNEENLINQSKDISTTENIHTFGNNSKDASNTNTQNSIGSLSLTHHSKTEGEVNDSNHLSMNTSKQSKEKSTGALKEIMDKDDE